jgi:hypothetical protein
VRESAQSWKELLLDLKRRGLAMAPKLAVADGALEASTSVSVGRTGISEGRASKPVGLLA